MMYIEHEKVTDAELEEMIRLVDKGKAVSPPMFRRLWMEWEQLKRENKAHQACRADIADLANKWTDLRSDSYYEGHEDGSLDGD